MEPAPPDHVALVRAIERLTNTIEVSGADQFWSGFLSALAVGLVLWMIAEVVRALIQRIDSLRGLCSESCVLIDVVDARLRDCGIPGTNRDDVMKDLVALSDGMLSTGLRLLHARSVWDWQARAFRVATHARKRSAARGMVTLSWNMKLPLGRTLSDMGKAAAELMQMADTVRKNLRCECIAATEEEWAASLESTVADHDDG